MSAGFGIVWNTRPRKGENFCVSKNVGKLRNRSDMPKGIWLDRDFRGPHESTPSKRRTGIQQLGDY